MKLTHTHTHIPQISGTHVCLRLLGMNSGQTRLSPSPLSVSPSRAHSCSRADAIAIDSAHSRPRVVRLCGAAALLEEKRDASGAEGGNRGRGLCCSVNARIPFWLLEQQQHGAGAKGHQGAVDQPGDGTRAATSRAPPKGRNSTKEEE